MRYLKELKLDVNSRAASVYLTDPLLLASFFVILSSDIVWIRPPPPYMLSELPGTHRCI
jgi:hypothetical protein